MRRIVTYPLSIVQRVALRDAVRQMRLRDKPRKTVVAPPKTRRTMVNPILLRNYRINKYKGQCPF